LTGRLTQALAILMASSVLLLAACGSDDDSTGRREPVDDPTPIAGVSTTSPFPVQYVRSDGKTLEVPKPAERIVSLSPGATEIIFALGAEGRLVAVDNQADYPPAAAGFGTRVDAYQPNVETIAGLNPDLVIVADNTGGIVEALDRLSLPVLYTDLDDSVKTIDDVFGQIGLLGRLTATDAKATELISSLDARVDAVEEKLTGLPNTRGPKVYHELDATFYSASTGTFIGSIYRTLHAQNIAGDGGGTSYPQLTQEAIIAADPDIIVLADEEFGVSIDSVRARPGWNAIKAVAENRIYAIDPDIISRPGPRIVDALEQLAKDFYPVTFGGTAPTPGTAELPTPTPVPTP
jgi:iron complex transport system substrate-binding protein